ncbi:hypothetical protein GCM10010297_46780 [Streptomyces malachitofuscus]|nr:hypothetical protein GCM10010297_46780 [Streptomyces malachitofuscus]
MGFPSEWSDEALSKRFDAHSEWGRVSRDPLRRIGCDARNSWEWRLCRMWPDILGILDVTLVCLWVFT